MKSSLGCLGMGLVIASTGCTTTVEDSSTSTARVRVAHLSPDAPAIDFCLAPAGTGEFAGPVLAGAGGLLGMSYGNVTKYIDVEAQQYDVRLVAPASADCSRGLGPDITGLPELPTGASATIAATGKLDHGTGGEPFALRAYIDDADVAADRAKLRFIHASPGTPNVDVGIGGGLLFTPVFENIEYGGDGNGYVTTSPFDGIELSARATGTPTDVLAIKPASLPAGAIVTAFAIGQIGNAQALGVLLCIDNNEHGLETECNIVGGAPERASVRIAHLSPDAPPVDVCITRSGTPYPAEPLLASLGSRAGLEYPQITNYLDLPAGSYDVRIVLASETTCVKNAVPDTIGVGVTAGLTATVAAIGVIDRSGPAANDPAFRLAVFADAATTTPGKGKLRFVHASPGTPAVDVGLGAGHGFTRVFSNVSFGNVGTSGALDAEGFIETDPFTSPVSARLAGGSTDALTIPNVSLPAGAIATAFAIGNKTGSLTNPLRVLLCTDNVRTPTLLASCVAAP